MINLRFCLVSVIRCTVSFDLLAKLPELSSSCTVYNLSRILSYEGKIKRGIPNWSTVFRLLTIDS